MSTTTDQLSTQSSGRDLSLRRTVDILCAGIAGFVLVPVFLILAAAIWLESGRPILYSQLRLGQNGTPFRIYKFRKFRVDCDDRGSPLTMEHDDRLTMIGRILAAVKLDELPQLWNILRGDMSIVGPRPETLAFADCFVNGFEEILEHRPGLFGPCQVIFRHESKLYPTGAGVQDFYREVIFPAKAKIDLAYYSRRTAASDIGWVLRAGCAIVMQSVIELARKGRSSESTT